MCIFWFLNQIFFKIKIKKIFVFMPIGEGKNKFQYERACIVLSFYHKFNLYLYYSGYQELCIILTKGIKLLSLGINTLYISFKYCKYPSKCIARN